MDKIVKYLRKKPFSGEDIMLVCDDKTKIITYPELYNYSDIDSVLNPHGCVVILYELKKAYGHWCCVLKNSDNQIEFFDPYGLFCDDQLDFIDKSFRKKNNEELPKLCEMIYNSGYPMIYNDVQLQKYSDDISSCGRHVAFRIVMRDTPLKQYTKILTNNHYDPDTIVTYLTAFV